ncbi:MAG: hypothetical protein WC413_03905 [Candidatus Nanoarchaeia archaeon]
MEVKRAFQILVYGIVLIALIGTLIGLSTKVVDNIINLFISAGLGLVFAAISGKVIELFSDDTLKEIFWTVEFELWGYEIEIPISLFTIFTIIIRLWWFG